MMMVKIPATRWISTHAPLAGRDSVAQGRCPPSHNFNPRAPCGARLGQGVHRVRLALISTHAPLAGRDEIGTVEQPGNRQFQPTRPLRGATYETAKHNMEELFQPTRPLRGATIGSLHVPFSLRQFQPTRPLRGATAKVYKSLCTFLR